MYRKTSRHGSSNYMEKEAPFIGILSNKAEENPGLYHLDITIGNLTKLNFKNYTLSLNSRMSSVLIWMFCCSADFFNWNRVKLLYCDGASFMGNSEDKVGDHLFMLLLRRILLQNFRYVLNTPDVVELIQVSGVILRFLNFLMKTLLNRKHNFFSEDNKSGRLLWRN